MIKVSIHSHLVFVFTKELIHNNVVMCQETGKKENGSTEDNSRIFPEAYLENQGTQQCQVFRPSNSEYEFVVGLQYIFA